jgi:transcriptional regulator with XRE-family HTH domain
MLDRHNFFRALGKRVRELRRKRGYSQEDMISFGFSARHWQQIETGRPITVSTLLRICQALKVSPEYLVREPNTITSGPAPRRHEVQFYSEDPVFLDNCSAFIATALEGGNSAIVMATNSHRIRLAQRLNARGVDVDSAIQAGTYISLDAADLLSTIMAGRSPDGDKFYDGLSGLVKQAAKAAPAEYPRIAIYGECCGLLCAEGKTNAAIRLESCGNDLIKTHNVDILCTYPITEFQSDKRKRAFKSICAEHSAVHFTPIGFPWDDE